MSDLKGKNKEKPMDIREVSRRHFRRRTANRLGIREELWIEYAAVGQGESRGTVWICFSSDSLDFEAMTATPERATKGPPNFDLYVNDPGWMEIKSRTESSAT